MNGPPIGNTELVNYGIREEESDIRAHVSVQGKVVYVFPTQEALTIIETRQYKSVAVYTNGIQTARGFLVPPDDIKHCQEVCPPFHVWQAIRFCDHDTTSAKGEKAVNVIRWLLRAGRFPLWLESQIIKDYEMQVKGTDILVRLDTKIQVKCDWKAGDRPGCTGNLFIQTAECNPFKMH